MDIYSQIKEHSGKRKIYDIIFFAFLSSFITSLENMFPRPIPYIRIGFSFIIILIILDVFTLKELILLIIIKNTSVALLFAYIFTPTFYLGILGGLAAIIIMKMARALKNTFSLYGIGVLGSLINNITQLFLLKYIFSIPDISFLLLPIIIISLISGSIVGGFALIFNKNNN